MDKNRFELLYKQEDIDEGLWRLSDQIKIDYENKDLVLLSVLKGAVIFTTDLIKKIEPFSYSLDFCRCSSYREQEKGEFKLELPQSSYSDNHILILDDIHDTGETIEKIHNELEKRNPLSIKSAVVINRLVSNKPSTPDYRLIDHEGDDWFVGYGMDLNERYRGLFDIYRLIK